MICSVALYSIAFGFLCLSFVYFLLCKIIRHIILELILNLAFQIKYSSTTTTKKKTTEIKTHHITDFSHTNGFNFKSYSLKEHWLIISKMFLFLLSHEIHEKLKTV